MLISLLAAVYTLLLGCNQVQRSVPYLHTVRVICSETGAATDGAASLMQQKAAHMRSHGVRSARQTSVIILGSTLLVLGWRIAANLVHS